MNFNRQIDKYLSSLPELIRDFAKTTIEHYFNEQDEYSAGIISGVFRTLEMTGFLGVGDSVDLVLCVYLSAPEKEVDSE